MFINVPSQQPYDQLQK